MLETIWKREPKPKMVVHASVEEEEVFTDYNERAERLGIKARITPSKLRNVLSDLALSAYDLAAVEKYMDEKGHWGWFPVRKLSDEEMQILLPISFRKLRTFFGSLYGAIRLNVYSEPIPYPVVCTMDQIQERLGEDAMFFIAALDESPDPFLAVTLRSDPSQFFVIERWDEPSFRG